MDNHTHAAFFDELEKIAEAEKSNLKRNLTIGGAALGTLALGLGARKGFKMRALSQKAAPSIAARGRRQGMHLMEQARDFARATRNTFAGKARAAAGYR